MKLAAFALIAVWLAHEQQPVFKAGVDAIRVDVLVTQRGQAVRGLTREAFEITDEGVTQVIDDVESSEQPVNAVLTFDLSESVSAERRDQLREASGALLEGLRPDDQAALITFDQLVVLRCRLTRERACVQQGLDQPQAVDATALIDSTYAALAVAESDPGRSLVVIFSDGLDTASWMADTRVVDAARRADAVVYAVSVGRSHKPRFLEDVVKATSGRLFEVENTANLRVMFVNILNEFRQRYVLTYTPRGVSDSGWHRLSVKVRQRGASVRARPGYLAGRAK